MGSSLTGITVVPLSKAHLSLLSTGSTQEDPSRYNLKNVDWDVKNQIKIKQNIKLNKTFSQIIKACLQIRELFFYFSSKTFVAGTQKNHLNEMVLLSTKNTCFNR